MIAVAYPALILVIGAIIYWKNPGGAWSRPALIAFAIGLFFVVSMLAHTTAKF